MTIHRFLQNLPLQPEDIARLEDAFERALKALSLVDRSDPIANLVARKIIELYQMGIHDVDQLSKLAVKQLDPR
jgi:hypothetical protein